MSLRYGISIGPKNEYDALLVKNSLIVATLHLHTHNQTLPLAVQIYGHQHLIGRNGLRGLSAKLQFLERPSAVLCHDLTSGGHASFREEGVSWPTFLEWSQSGFIYRVNWLQKLLRSSLKGPLWKQLFQNDSFTKAVKSNLF